MLRRLLLPFLVAAALVAPVAGPAAAQSAPEAVAADVNAYWAGQFAEAGIAYSPPGFVPVTGESTTGCGPVSPDVIGPAAYCLLDSTIYYSPDYLNLYASEADPTAYFVIIAHEWGHHVSRLLGSEAPISPETEQQADCASGAYLADAVARGFAPAGSLNRGTGLSIRAGDPTFLPDGFQTHGNGAYRGIAFMEGYMNGLEACGLGL
jgi:hypothetical protein